MSQLSIYRFAARSVAGLVLLVGLGVLVPWGKWFDRVLPQPSTTELYQVALKAIAENDVPAVQTVAESMADRDDARPYAALLEGFVHWRSGRSREAVAAFEAARESPMTGAMANMFAGEILYRNRQYQDAIDALTAAVELDGSLTDAHRRLAAILYDIGSTELAVRELRIVSEQAPDDPRPHRLMGLMYKDMEAFEKAVGEYREALRRDPDLPERGDVLLELATCLSKLGRPDELREVIRQCPRTADAMTLEAELLLSEGKSKEATALADEALTETPSHLDALLLKGTIQQLDGNVAEAVKTFQRAVQEHPLDYRAHHKLSQAYARSGDNELARKSTEESERLRALREHFAELHAKVSGNTTDAGLRFELAKAATELGYTDIAMSWYQAVIALDPNHQAARQALLEAQKQK